MAEADVVPGDGVEGDSFVRAGEKLRLARESGGHSLTELSRMTKINERHLAAIERSDFAALPARIYAVGFARSYAGALGLDSARIASQVRSEVKAVEEPATNRPAYDLDIEDSSKTASRGFAWLAAGLALTALVGGAMFWRSYFVPAVDLPPVSERVLATVTTAPEFSPSAAISPTAESAVPAAPLAAPLAPADPTANPAAAPGRGITPAASGVQRLPRPMPEQQLPAPQAAAAPAGAPLNPPPSD